MRDAAGSSPATLAETVAATIAATAPVTVAAAAPATVTAATPAATPANAPTTIPAVVSTASGDRHGRGRALSEVDIEVARIDPHQAEQITRTMIASAGKAIPFRCGTLAGLRPSTLRNALSALAGVAAEMVRIDPRHAWELANETEAADTYASTGSAKSELLSHLAAAWSAVDPQRAAEAVEEAVRINLSEKRDNSGLEALQDSEVPVAVTALLTTTARSTTDPDRACRLPPELVHIAETASSEDQPDLVLAIAAMSWRSRCPLS